MAEIAHIVALIVGGLAFWVGEAGEVAVGIIGGCGGDVLCGGGAFYCGGEALALGIVGVAGDALLWGACGLGHLAEVAVAVILILCEVATFVGTSEWLAEVGIIGGGAFAAIGIGGAEEVAGIVIAIAGELTAFVDAFFFGVAPAVKLADNTAATFTLDEAPFSIIDAFYFAAIGIVDLYGVFTAAAAIVEHVFCYLTEWIDKFADAGDLLGFDIAGAGDGVDGGIAAATTAIAA